MSTTTFTEFPPDPFAPCDVCDAENVPLTRVKNPYTLGFPVEVCANCLPDLLNTMAHRGDPS